MRSWKTALSGRPGPVVLALPEDMLAEKVDVETVNLSSTAEPAPTPKAMAELGRLIAEARHPLMVVGGPGWSAECAARVKALDAGGSYLIDLAVDPQGLTPTQSLEAAREMDRSRLQARVTAKQA